MNHIVIKSVGTMMPLLTAPLNSSDYSSISPSLITLVGWLEFYCTFRVITYCEKYILTNVSTEHSSRSLLNEKSKWVFGSSHCFSDHTSELYSQ